MRIKLLKLPYFHIEFAPNTCLKFQGPTCHDHFARRIQVLHFKVTDTVNNTVTNFQLSWKNFINHMSLYLSPYFPGIFGTSNGLIQVLHTSLVKDTEKEINQSDEVYKWLYISSFFVLIFFFLLLLLFVMFISFL